MLSTTKLFSLAVLSALGMGASFAGAVQIAGYEWDGGYDVTSLPDASAPTWTKYGASGSAGTVSSGVLTIDSTNALFGPEDGSIPGFLGYFLPPNGDAGAWNPSGVASSYVQFGLKVNSQGTAPFAGFLRSSDGVDHNISLYFGTKDGNTGLFDNTYSFIKALDLSVTHDIRVQIDPVADTYTLQVDDFATPGIAIASFENSSGATLIMGGNGDAVGSFDIDYVAWNNASAPVAVPEPVSLLGMLSVGAIALGRRSAVR